MRRVLAGLVIGVLVFALAIAAVGPVSAGQPSVECDVFSSSPGHASDARGSAFAEGGIAGQHYAGEQDQNDNNVHSVSQYDVACEKVSNP
jgi:hypothetical protein